MNNIVLLECAGKAQRNHNVQSLEQALEIIANHINSGGCLKVALYDKSTDVYIGAVPRVVHV